jgi:hypothetical protein
MLTDKTVDALKPKPEKHQWIETDHKPGDNPGKTCRGFGVKVMRSGTKTYVVSYRVDGREREFVIGSCSEWKCADARKKLGRPEGWPKTERTRKASESGPERRPPSTILLCTTARSSCRGKSPGVKRKTIALSINGYCPS